MALKKTYGHIHLNDHKQWEIDEIEPHVAIKLKSLFLHIPRAQPAPFHFEDNIEVCADIIWFMSRYPFRISDKDLNRMKGKKRQFVKRNDELEAILAPDYVPADVSLKDGFKARDYQVKGKEVFWAVNRMLLGDELGLGKTVTGIISILDQKRLPAFVVCQPHLIKHWEEQIDKFTNLNTHVLKDGPVYSLPVADVYIIKYTQLRKWVDVFRILKYKTVIYDEVQECRRNESLKYRAAKVLSSHAAHVLGLSATPIYNYGSEIFNIMQVIKEDCLGSRDEFYRQWSSYGEQVKDPKALGTYLRENYLLLRRTREEVGRELPVVNTIIHTVDYDEEEVEKTEELARTLAIRVMEGTYVERGQAAREFDMRLRQTTGVSKAKYVAEYVKFLVQAGEPVVLAGWHRDVYEIWERELRDLNPVFYTGTESPAKKNQAKEMFVSGESKVFIISLRSGIGLDGLQFGSRTVVFGELDWSPQVMKQLIGRVDRDGQEHQVTAIYLISEYGSDLPIIDMLGIKSSQSHYINDPMVAIKEKHTDESRIRAMAQKFLNNQTEKAQ